MLRWASKRILSQSYVQTISRATYKNYVMNDNLALIERECDKFCYHPRVPPHKVCVVGAGSDVGRIVSLFLKQQNIIRVLAMYDDYPENHVLGVANDIAHIDTSTSVEAYQGRVYLKAALYDSDVVLICGGCYVMPPHCNIQDRDLFMKNMQFVRTVTRAVAEFAPQAILAIQTPPVDANFALAKYTLELVKKYDPRCLLGVNSINSMRANQLFCSITGIEPSKMSIPVVCGACRCTRVPVFSIAKPANIPQSQIDCLTRLVREADDIICRVKNIPQSQVDCLTRLVREADDIICRVKSNNEQGHLSIGFSTARLITNIMKGLFEKPTFIDSALVEQADPKKCFDLPICATPVTIGKGGIVEYAIPNLNEAESELLENCKCDLEDMLNLGRCFALGEDYYVHPSKYCQQEFCSEPPVAEPCDKKNSKN